MSTRLTQQKSKQAVQKNVLSIFPSMQQERAKKFTTLTLTLFLLCVFGIFAISPTLSTIAQLKKKIKDSTDVSQSLDTKIKNLNTLHTIYAQTAYNLPLVFAALPQTAKTTYIVGQLQELAQENNVTIEAIQVEEVDLTKKTATTGSFSFILTADGTKDTLDAFVRSLMGFDRILTLDTITYTQTDTTSDKYTLNLRSKAYFLQ